MFDVDYGFTRRLPDTDLRTAKKRITDALSQEGFGILTEIDVRETMKKKLDVDFRPYLILGACNPQLAHRALTNEPALGLVLPCNVVVAEDDAGGAVISILKPETMFSIVDRPGMEPLVKEATERLTSALEKA